MAATWQLQGIGIPLALANESLLAIHNDNASSIISVYKIWLQNNQTTQITGTQNILTLTRYTGATLTANSALWTPVTYDSTNASFPASITCGSKMTLATPTTTVVFRRRAWTNNEPAVQTALPAVFQVPKEWNTLWDVSWVDSNIEPIVLRQGSSLSVQNVGLTATAPANAGLIDVFMEFTVT